MAACAAAALFLAPRQASCKDFPEPVAVADPLEASAGPGIPAGLGAAFEHGSYLFAHDDIDGFYMRVGASPVILDLGGIFALGGNYEAILMCVPVPEGETPVNIAAFWMNAVQFEYGLYASLDLGRAIAPLRGKAGAGLRFLAEYSRTSQHPLRHEYSEEADDILMVGISMPERTLFPGRAAGELRLRCCLRIGWRELFAFWQSTLPQPRISWIAKSEAEALLPLAGRLGLVVRVYPEVFLDRRSKSIDANLFSEAGLSLGRDAFRDELLATLYATGDSDMLDGVAHPTFEAGLAIRFSAGR
jgi:hypothetical protein